MYPRQNIKSVFETFVTKKSEIIISTFVTLVTLTFVKYYFKLSKIALFEISFESKQKYYAKMSIFCPVKVKVKVIQIMVVNVKTVHVAKSPTRPLALYFYFP